MRETISRHALTAWLALALTACGGGGTTGPLIATDQTLIRVAVVDSGFKLDHPQLVGTYTDAREFAGTGTLEDNVFRHGTYVAQTLAGNTVGATDNATLLLAKAADSQGLIYTDKIYAATQWAVSGGARVINYSLAPMYTFSAGDFLDMTYATALTASGGMGAVMVMSAGNIEPSGGTYNLSSGNISSQKYNTNSFFGGNDNYNAISLIAGAVDSAGNRQPYSFYPGETAEVQSRFLVAVTPVTVKSVSGASNYSFDGTSASAAVVSAATTDILSRWPFLTAQEVSRILLTTANRSFSAQYNLNTCGPSNNVNCGLFYFGQGLLDLNTALQPVGTTSLVTGSSVSGSAYPVASSQLVLPSAFGDSALDLQLDAAMFDSFGRDFRFNLGQRIRGAAARTGLQQWMLSLGGQEVITQDDKVKVRNTFSADGQMQSSRLAIGLTQDLQWHWQRDKGHALSGSRDLAPLPLLSLNGQGVLGAYGTVDQLGLTWSTNDNQRLTARLSRAQSAQKANTDEPVAWRYATELEWRHGPATRVRAGLSLTTETQGLLGQRSTGALALQRSLAHAATLDLQHNLGQGWLAFASAELGTLQVLGNTLLAGMDPALTTAWMAGLGWQGEGQRWGLAMSQPLRVERATARFDLPVGRTLDGTVLREQRAVSLAPSGRQMNLEMAWQQDLNGRGDSLSSLGLHAIYTHDSGHRAGQRDWSLLGSYRLRW